MNTSPGLATADEPASASLQERKQEFARNAIWDAAVDLFFEKGFDETTVDEIAVRAGTSRRSFFRHFESKSDLMARPVLDWGIALAAAIDSCPGSMPLAVILHEVVSKVARESSSNPRSRKLMQIAARHPAAREAQLSRISDVYDLLEAAFGKRSKDSATVHLLSGLLFAVLGATHQCWFEKREKDISLTAQKVLAALSKIACDIDSSGDKHKSRQAARHRARTRRQ